MAIKKSELYSSLWKSCDELRGGMDASQYKDYVLVLLFVKYVSDKAASQKGYLLDVPKGGSFADMVALKGDKEIGDRMNKIIAKLAEANNLRGVIDVADFNDSDKLGRGKDMVDRLSNLVSIFDSPNLDFSGNRVEGDDLLGDAYEYLMRNFATESGKSKGQFYTPAEVSRMMAKVVGVGSAKSTSQAIHDPTCGSGSLLLKAHDEAKSVTGLDLALYGQEMDNATSALARMNMILHDCPTAEIWQDNVLSSPHFKSSDGTLKTFDFVVANPPFSFKAWSNGFNPMADEYKRFEFGVPPTKNGDLAFLLHILTCLKSTGKVKALPEGLRKHKEAAAETIENNVRKLIIDESPINPKYYEKMSELLDALIEQRQREALDYAAYLAKIVELTKQAKHGPGAAAYPRMLDTPAKRALYDNLDKDETLALAVHEAVHANQQDDWRNNPFKIKRVRNAIKAALKDDEPVTERVLELVKNQHEY